MSCQVAKISVPGAAGEEASSSESSGTQYATGAKRRKDEDERGRCGNKKVKDATCIFKKFQSYARV